MTITEIERSKNQATLARTAARLNDAAFTGQRYVIETIDASLFAIVLHDADTMNVAPVLTFRKDRRERFDSRAFASMAGHRSRGSMRGSYNVFA